MVFLLVIIAVVFFALAAIPKTRDAAWVPLGLIFLSLAHVWSSLVVYIK